jgi:hypothetical protein
VGIAAAVFWLVRERHLYWGDALPLSIQVPAGQRFHPDEPLTLWFHHAAWALGGGRWSAVQAIAAASAVAGGVWVALHARSFARTPGPVGSSAAGPALLATLAIASQGAAAIFHGHVENYAYVAVCLAAFAWTGVDYLERRGPAWPPFAALFASYAFHLLGALALPAAAVLVWHGLTRHDRRREMLATLAVLALATAAVSWAVRGLYPGASPFAQLADGVMKVVQQPRDMQAGVFFSARHLADAWSHVVQMGPLSLVAVVLLVVARPLRGTLAGASGRFLAVAAITLYAPALLTGAGNLGAARNWDLFAAPATVLPLFALRALLALGAGRAGPPAARGPCQLARAGPAVDRAQHGSRRDRGARRGAAPGRRPLRGDARHRGLECRRPAARRTLVRGVARGGLAQRQRAERPRARARTRRSTRRGGAAARSRGGVEAGDGAVPSRSRHALHAHRALGAGRRRMAGGAAARADRARGVARALGGAGRVGPPRQLGLRTARRGEALPADRAIAQALADACALWVASAGERGDRAEFAHAWAVFASRFPDDPRVRGWRPRAEALLGGPKR